MRRWIAWYWYDFKLMLSLYWSDIKVTLRRWFG